MAGIDYTGKVYNNCIVIGKDEKRTQEKKRTHWLLKCQNCGEILSRRGDNLFNIKCKCQSRKPYSQKNRNEERIKAMLNKRFGKLTVIEYIADRRAPDGSLLYKCKCDCGNYCNKSGTALRAGTKSCGCLIGKSNNNRFNDLSGQKYNLVTILSPTNKRDSSRRVVYKCKCDCGTIFETAGTKVKKGYVKSCGCLQKINLQKYLDTVNYATDETGNVYGKLTVLYRNGSTSNWQAIWHCRCECGKEIDVPGTRLRSGQISCGCLNMSKEAYSIYLLLKQNNISFVTEKKFQECKDIKALPFDFYVQDKYIIEFDGIQHFHSFKHFGGDEKFIVRRKHDLIKNQYCFEYNIPLIRIPYNADYNFNDLVLETTRFLFTPEDEKEYYEQER